MNKIYLYHLIAIFTVVVWGVTFVSTKVLIGRGMTPESIFFCRFTLAYFCMWFISHKRLWAKSIKDELLFMAAGLSGGSLYFIAENTALGITLASNVSLIICTAPILTAFLSLLFYKRERIRPNLILGSAIAFTGVALVVYNGSFVLKINPLGDLLTVLAALMWAFYCIILRKTASRYPTLFVTRKVFFYGLVTLLPFFCVRPFSLERDLLLQPVVWLNLLFLGFVASLLCYIMWNTAVKELGAIRAANYIYIIPLVTLLTSALVIDETITVISLLGSALILCGVYIAERNGAFFSRLTLKLKKS